MYERAKDVQLTRGGLSPVASYSASPVIVTNECVSLYLQNRDGAVETANGCGVWRMISK